MMEKTRFTVIFERPPRIKEETFGSFCMMPFVERLYVKVSAMDREAAIAAASESTGASKINEWTGNPLWLVRGIREGAKFTVWY